MKIKSLFVITLGTLSSFNFCQAQAKKLKNIIFISFDQLGAGSIGCYGSGINSTPFLDKIASEGTIFTRCYPVFAACAPSRATWLTGRSPAIHGVASNNFALPMDLPTYASVLKRSGYYTGAFGKLHQTPMWLPVPKDLKFLGFDEAIVTEDPKWGPWIEWVKEKYPDYYMKALSMAWGTGSEFFGKYRNDYQKALKEILQPLIDESGWQTMYCSPLPAKVHDATFITEKSIEFIKGHINASHPFFCHISYIDPHDPYNPPQEYCDLYKPEDMSDPIPAEWENQGYETLDFWYTDKLYLRLDKIKDDYWKVKKMRALYHGSLRFLDDQVKHLVDFLKEMDLWENTIVIITSDHGEMIGDHGMISKGPHPWDLGIRVPLIVTGGGVKSQVSDRLTSCLDYYPTFCEWAGVAQEDMPPVEGHSFASVCIGKPELNGWNEVICEFRWDVPTMGFKSVYSVLTDDYWRLSYFVNDGKGMMVNLKEDKQEINNLYYKPEFAAKKVELLERMMKAVSRPFTIPVYRNMPLWKGKKMDENGKNGIIPYDFIPSPALIEDKSGLYGIFN
jgi:arylsulfatase